LSRQGLLIQAAKPENLTERMTVLFSLAIPEKAKAALEEKVARGETVSAEELQKSFSPKEMDINALLKWLHAHPTRTAPGTTRPAKFRWSTNHPTPAWWRWVGRA
jgi:hypothetical protein